MTQDRKNSNNAYNQLVRDYGKEAIMQAIGTEADYYNIVWLNGERSFFDVWLSTPEPDWQRDC
jgi:hypothetical protein